MKTTTLSVCRTLSFWMFCLLLSPVDKKKPQQLQCIKMPAVDCAPIRARLHRSYPSVPFDNWLCAHSQGKDTCRVSCPGHVLHLHFIHSSHGVCVCFCVPGWLWWRRCVQEQDLWCRQRWSSYMCLCGAMFFCESLSIHKMDSASHWKVNLMLNSHNTFAMWLWLLNSLSDYLFTFSVFSVQKSRESKLYS